MSDITTPRLRELEAIKGGYEKAGEISPNDRLDYLTLRAHIRGYRMALKDLAPVIKATRKFIFHPHGSARVQATRGRPGGVGGPK